MMAHLRDTELIDLLDGTLPAARRRHAAECAECRDKAAMISAAAGRAAESEIPEPSPLFWTQLSARVRDAIAAEPVPRSRFFPRFAFPHSRFAALTAAAVMILAAGIWLARLPVGPGDAPGPPISTAASVPSGDPQSEEPFDIEADEGWALVRSIADDLGPEDIDDAGVTARPGSAEHATRSLSERERIELARLLEAEIKVGGVESSS